MDEDINAGEIAEAAAQPGIEEASGIEPKMVPLEALEKIRSELKDLKDENVNLRRNVQTYSDHFEMLKNQYTQSKPQQDEFSGMQDDEFLTVGQAKKLAEQMQKYNQQMVAQTQQSTAELQMMAAAPDYKEVIEKYLPLAIEEDPDLKSEIQNSANPYKYAYKMAKRSSAYMKDSAKKNLSPQSQKVLDNYTKPQSLSAVGTNAPVTGVGKYKSMSNEDFRKLVAQNTGQY